MNLFVIGRSIGIEPIPGEMLAELLRYRLGLTGTKIGCNEAECGACTVLVDSEPVFSCTYPAAKANGRENLTIECHAVPRPDAFEIITGAAKFTDDLSCGGWTFPKRSLPGAAPVLARLRQRAGDAV